MLVESVSVLQAFRAISDKYARGILLSTSRSAWSVEEISIENGIPVSTCYRRVNELISEGLLQIAQTTITPHGKKYHTFKAIFRAINVSICCGEISVEIKNDHGDQEMPPEKESGEQDRSTKYNQLVSCSAEQVCRSR